MVAGRFALCGEQQIDLSRRPAANTLGAHVMVEPNHIEIIGAEVAIRWSDGMESFFPAEFLRANSPSAENVGERDLFGRKMGGSNQRTFPGVIVTGWERVGNYAIRFDFSDGHRTGLYIFDYLRDLHRQLEEPKG
jgi:DUF971 family protein